VNKDDLIAFENRIGKHYENGDLPFLFHLSGGNEDQLIELFKNIDEKDYVLSNHRSHYHALLHGISPEKLEKMIIDGRSMFVYDKDKNFFCSAIIGGTPGIAIGIAWALKRKRSKQKVWCFVGDGTEDNGHLFEAIRYAEGWDLPCIFVIENNNRSVEATNADRWGATSDYEWNSNKVIKYKYDITFPHARKPGIVDLSKTKPKSHGEYFPPYSYPEVEKVSSEISYKEAIFESMEDLGRKGYIFIGYNVLKGNAMGTLASVPDSQKIETPVAENLMMGLAIGMSFEGFKPVVYFERQDFMMVAMDAIVNHLDKIERISHGEFKVPVIIRAVVADGGPFYSGITHSQDFTKMFQAVLQMPIFVPESGTDVKTAFEYGSSIDKPIMVVEYKSRY
jgi:deoxyxylulose-5-phosphate synthase